MTGVRASRKIAQDPLFPALHDFTRMLISFIMSKQNNDFISYRMDTHTTTVREPPLTVGVPRGTRKIIYTKLPPSETLFITYRRRRCGGVESTTFTCKIRQTNSIMCECDTISHQNLICSNKSSVDRRLHFTHFGVGV